MTNGAITLSRSGDGYLQVLTPALVWLSGLLWHRPALLRCDRDARRANHLLHHEEHAEASARCDFKKNLKSLIAASDKFSFPSGHTSAAFCFSTITIITFGGAYAAMFIWASLVGASRVIIGVHYPGDIVAGAVMGSGIAVGTASMLNIW